MIKIANCFFTTSTVVLVEAIVQATATAVGAKERVKAAGAKERAKAAVV